MRSLAPAHAGRVPAAARESPGAEDHDGRTSAPIVSRDDYLPAEMYLESNVAGVAAVNGGLEIRGRGNSTWSMPKKPYRLKLTDKHGAARHAVEPGLGAAR